MSDRWRADESLTAERADELADALKKFTPYCGDDHEYTCTDCHLKLPADWSLIAVGLRAFAALKRREVAFANEFGNQIRITIEGPNSIAENVITPTEASHLRELLNLRTDSVSPVSHPKR